MTILEEAAATLERTTESIAQSPTFLERIRNWSLKMVYEFVTETDRAVRMVVFDQGRCSVEVPTDPTYPGCSVFRMHPEVYLKLVAEEMDSRTAVTSGALKVIKVASIPDLLKMRQLMNFSKTIQPASTCPGDNGRFPIGKGG